MISRMHQKRSPQSKRKPSNGKRRRSAAKTFAKRVSPKFRPRGTVDEAIKRASERFADALKRLADK
jgi:ribosomal protein S20